MATNDTTTQTNVQDTTQDTTAQNNNSTQNTNYYSDPAVQTAATDAASANTKSYADTITKQYDSAYQQQAAQIDYQTQQNIQDAVQTYNDSKQDYTDQYHTYTNQLYQGRDNAALNSRASGQFGGTATANVAAAMNQYQAARQQLAVQQQQVATDAVRQIESLRSQGEFDKADALLQQTQAKLSALYQDAIRVDENQYSNWQYQNTVDRENAEIQRQQEETDKSWYQTMGMTLLNKGVMPDQTILNALGLSQSAAQTYINMVLYGADATNTANLYST